MRSLDQEAGGSSVRATSTFALDFAGLDADGHATRRPLRLLDPLRAAIC